MDEQITANKYKGYSRADNRNIWVDYLRSFLTVLVVAHHSTLAYTTFASFDAEAYIRSTHPMVDAHRWIGLDIFQNFNDIFFMSLMFLVGGLFLSRSIARKGMVTFILDRMYRLFIPFLFLGTLFMLIAHFPSYYVAHGHTGITAYVLDFFTVEQWPVGPPWFIWVLFVFNVVFALISPVLQSYSRQIAKGVDILGKHPVWAVFLLLAVTWVLYVPVAYTAGPGTWTGWGPFDFQVSRIALYFGYFMTGVCIGYTRFNEGLFSAKSVLVKYWWLWGLFAVGIYTVLTILSGSLGAMFRQGTISEFQAWMIYYTLYVGSCVLSCVACITLFRRFAKHEVSWWRSLSDNAYLIYLIHYIFVIWIQFLLRDAGIPALVKFFITFSGALGLSWVTAVGMRKIKPVRHYL